MIGDRTMADRKRAFVHGASFGWWRWRFQPVWGLWGHLGIDYSYEAPRLHGPGFFLRHMDYGLPGDRTHPRYRHCIALYAAMIAPNGKGWPPLRTPRGSVYLASTFRRAPQAVLEHLQHRVPRFWGGYGAYRSWGPNSNSGLRAALRACEAATGYRFGRPPLRMWLGAIGWSYPLRMQPTEGPFPGYFESATRLRWRDTRSIMPFDNADDQAMERR